MRAMVLQDVFAMGRIISKVGMANEIKDIVARVKEAENNKENSKEMIEKVGVEFIFALIEKASNKEVEKEIFAFASDVMEVEIGQLRMMRPKELVKLISESGADAEEWKDFFMRAVRFAANQ